jgi:hypothetical protein
MRDEASWSMANERALSTEQVAQVLKLVKGSDSVELKLSVPDQDQRSVVRSLGMDPLEAQIRQVAFFDTPDLTLDKAGVVVRARRVQGKGGDTVVKLRPIVPDDVPREVRRSASFNIELDAMPGGFVCSGSMKGMADNEEIKGVMAGARPLRKLLSKEQRAIYETHAPEGIGLDALACLGPLNILKLRFTPPDFGRRLVAELWLYPDGSRILELSTKCLPTEAFEVAAQVRAYLGEKGVDLSGEQQTKTRRALSYFSGQLREAAPTTAAPLKV